MARCDGISLLRDIISLYILLEARRGLVAHPMHWCPMAIRMFIGNIVLVFIDRNVVLAVSLRFNGCFRYSDWQYSHFISTMGLYIWHGVRISWVFQQSSWNYIIFQTYELIVDLIPINSHPVCPFRLNNRSSNTSMPTYIYIYIYNMYIHIYIIVESILGSQI